MAEIQSSGAAAGLGSDPSRIAVILVASFLTEADTIISGGRPRIVRDLARHLRKHSYVVRIVQKGSRNGVTEFEPGISVQTVRAPMPMWADLYFALRTRVISRRAAVCCYATPEDGFPFFSDRAFAIQHGIWWDGPRYTGLWGLLVKTVQRVRNRRLCSRMRFVLCVDTNYANHLRLQGRRQQETVRKCVYSPNYVTLPRERAIPGLAKIDERFRARRILFLRRLEPPRGAMVFLETCRELRDSGFAFQAEICGWGSQRSLVAATILKFGLADQVHMSDADLDQAADVLDRAALSVVPSLWSEGSSLSAIESIGEGVPVIASDTGGLGNVVIPGFNGQVSRAEPKALAAEIRRTLSDWATYAEMARNCLSMRGALSFTRWATTLDDALIDAGLLHSYRNEPRNGTEASPDFDKVLAGNR